MGVEFEAKKEEGRQLKEEEYAATPNYPSFTDIVRGIQLQILDTQWKEHLHTMDALRESINLRGYAQRDPKIEYQREGFGLFGEMEQRMDDQLAGFVFKFGYPRPRVEARASARSVAGAPAANAQGAAGQAQAAGGAAQAGGAAAAAVGPAGSQPSGPVAKVGRNEPCPCGSGKKYKKCCGA